MYSTQNPFQHVDNHTGFRGDKGTSWGLFSRLTHGAAELYHSAGNAVSGPVETISGVAANAYHGAVDRANKASGYVQRAEHGITRGLHTAEDWVDQGSHAVARRVANVPVLSSVARVAADRMTVGTQIVGGVLGGATTLAGGIANAELHPLDTMAGIEAMVEHTHGPLGTMARGTHDLINVVRGRQMVGGMINRAVNPLATAREDAEFWGRMGSAIAAPYRQSIKEGRPGEAVGRGLFDIGSMLIGAGEVGEAARGVGVAGDVARAGDVADAARVADTAGQTTRALGATADGARAGESTANASHALDAAAEAAKAPTAHEGSLATHAEEHLTPPVPDPGLADRGYRPGPGERAETRQQYRARRSQERAEATVAAADQPLENPMPGAAQHGHGHARHGWQTTDAQQADRVVNGRYPDQLPTEAPVDGPAARASHFSSPQAEAEALGRARRELQRDLNAGIVPAHVDPVTGARIHFDPATGEPVRVKKIVPTNRPGGYGTSQVVRRQPPPSTSFALDAAGNRVAVPSSTPLPRARVIFEHVPSLGKWETVTHYPEPMPLPGGQTNLW